MRGVVGTNAYSFTELTLLMQLRKDNVGFPQIRSILISAGFKERSLDGLKRAVRRRREGFLPPAPPRPPKKIPQSASSDTPTVRAQSIRSDARFCKAMARERPQTGASKSFGTDSPHPIAPPLSGQLSASRWVYR